MKIKLITQMKNLIKRIKINLKENIKMELNWNI